jgi:hypothetical protein
MVVRHYDVKYNREQVYNWLLEFKKQKKVKDRRKWLVEKLGDDAQLLIRVPGAEQGSTTKPLIDVLLDDLDSYVLPEK